MNPFSADGYASETEIVAEFSPSEAALAREMLALRQQPGAALEAHIRTLAPATATRAGPRTAWWDWRQWHPRQRWAAGVIAIAIVLACALAVAGPKRVLAQIQQWLNYVPGMGFVDLEQTRVLTAPVEVTQGGVTLQVIQVVVDVHRTNVVFRWQPDTPGTRSTGATQSAQAPSVTAYLRLEDGSTLASIGGVFGPGMGNVQFPPLPPTAYRIALMLSLGTDAGGNSGSKHWEVPFILRPATGELIANLFPASYTPAGAGVTGSGVTVRALAVTHSRSYTVLRVRVAWQDPWWQFSSFLGTQSPELRDEIGHVYEPVPPLMGGFTQQVVPAGPPGSPPSAPNGEPVFDADLYYASLSPSAATLTFTVPEINFDVPVYKALTVDLDANPRVGDYIPLAVCRREKPLCT